MNSFHKGGLKNQERVKELRVTKGISQQELAEKSGLSIRTIQRIENNETAPHGDTLRRIFEVLHSEPNFSAKKVNGNNVIMKRILSYYRNWKILVFSYLLCLTVFFSSMVIRAEFIGKGSFIFSFVFFFYY